MIIQGLIDVVCIWVSGLLSLLPPLPPMFTDGLTWITGSLNWVSAHVGGVGAVIPFDVLYNISLAWVGAWAFFIAMAALRLVLWILGR